MITVTQLHVWHPTKWLTLTDQLRFVELGTEMQKKTQKVCMMCSWKSSSWITQRSGLTTQVGVNKFELGWLETWIRERGRERAGEGEKERSKKFLWCFQRKMNTCDVNRWLGNPTKWLIWKHTLIWLPRTELVRKWKFSNVLKKK